MSHLSHLAAAALLTVCASCASTVESPQLYLLTSSYAHEGVNGPIRVYEFDEDALTTRLVGSYDSIANPSFFTLSADATRLYAVGESDGAAMIHALNLQLTTGTFSPLNDQPALGGAPCNVTFTPDSSAVITANYMGGSISRFPLDADGRLQPGTVTPFTTSGLDPERQGQAHLHAVSFTPDDAYMLCNDLGGDCIHIFRTSDGSALPDLYIKAGSGPRHITWNKDGHHAYLIGEISDEVYVIDYNEGEFTLHQTLTAAETVAGGAADIHLSPDGHHLYASHRLEGDGVSIFSVGDDGLLTRIGFQPTGRHPRNFALSPDGTLLLVACRDDHRVEIYRRDAATGLLTPTDQRIDIPAPVCLRFVEK